MQQKRLILALLISTAILFLWGYLFPIAPPVKPPTPEAPTNASPTVAPTPIPTSATPTVPSEGAAQPAQQEPARTVKIKTPLYEATLDSVGAEITSWIIKKNKDTGREIHSVSGNKNNPVPLELISPVGLKRTPRDVPLQLSTGDNAVDAVLARATYRVEEVDTSSGDVAIELAPGEKRTVAFLFEDPATGLSVVKRIGFDAESYTPDLEVTIKRGGQVIPQAKIKIGPSIGDQGIKHYTFYSVAPEAIAAVSGEVQRHAAAGINENKGDPDRLTVPGLVDWGGVGDTYFAMVAIPSKPAEGLEFRTVQYDHQKNGTPEKRYLVSAWVPIPTDGARTVLYVGPKDHFILTKVNSAVQASLGRSVDLEGLIDYGWFSWLSRPISVPILKAIKWLHQLTNSYGVAIILFTIVIYSLFFPLKWRSSKAMKKAQKLAPRMKELQEKIKGMKQTDPRLKELQMEQLRLMKEGNPLGGCLPLLIQMPFLFALYRAITISLDFRQATFLWLPDLSAGDPYHILEILMSGTMIVLQLITPAPSADPLQRKMMAIGMPLFMLYVLWGAPSGLLLYWLVGNIVGFSQQFLINRWTSSEGDDKPPSLGKGPRAAKAQ
jgi:YidC/Oxa1 family membrane protein insertase